MLIVPNSILLDEEGHIKITGQCIQLQTILCLSVVRLSIHLLLNANLSASLVSLPLCFRLWPE